MTTTSSPEGIRPRVLRGAMAVLLASLAGCAGAGDPEVVTPGSLSASPTPAQGPAPATTTDPESPTAQGEDVAVTTGPPAPDDASATSGPVPDTDLSTVTSTADGDEPLAAPPPAQDFPADDPRVVAVQAYAEEFARAATTADPDRPAWLATMTPGAQEQRGQIIADDLGLTYPGPLPFTVTQVQERADVTVVEVCLLSAGFAVDPATDLPGDQEVLGAEFHLVPGPGGLLVDGLYAGNNLCDNVRVEGRAW